MDVTTNKTDINVLALLQARTSSTRLPNKVMLPILGVPMILRQIERLQRTTLIDHFSPYWLLRLIDQSMLFVASVRFVLKSSAHLI